MWCDVMYVYPCDGTYSKISQPGQEQLKSLELSETLKTCGLCSASSTQNTSNTETHCQAVCTNSPPNLQGKHFICWKKTEGLTKTPWKYLEAWWTELRWCKNLGEVPLCSWLRQVRLEWCSVCNILVLGRMEKFNFFILSMFWFFWKANDLD